MKTIMSRLFNRTFSRTLSRGIFSLFAALVVFGAACTVTASAQVLSPGEELTLHVSTSATQFSVEIARVGVE
ncbi:MAG: hypothetical protein JNL32_08640, partial [Candidatus Kapabacteria bacterium]|nr:hypothetical protein [Candidatus Kapabacteria bacterium]